MLIDLFIGESDHCCNGDDPLHNTFFGCGLVSKSSKSGAKILFFRHHRYNHAKRLKNGQVFWSCSQKDCQAKVWTRSWTINTVIKMKGDHSERCLVDLNKILADGMVWDMKMKMKEKGLMRTFIVGPQIKYTSDEIILALPSFESLQRCFQRIGPVCKPKNCDCNREACRQLALSKRTSRNRRYVLRSRNVYATKIKKRERRTRGEFCTCCLYVWAHVDRNHFGESSSLGWVVLPR